MPGATRSIVIDAPVEKVFEVITAYEKYPEIFPEVREVRTSNRNGNQVQVHYKVDLVKTIKYSLNVTENRPTSMSWTFIEGEFMKDNKGGWQLEALPDGKTKATYNVEVTLGALVPKTIVNTLVETSLPKMLENVKKKVEGM